jgi:hypothetical protein
MQGMRPDVRVAHACQAEQAIPGESQGERVEETGLPGPLFGDSDAKAGGKALDPPERVRVSENQAGVGQQCQNHLPGYGNFDPGLTSCSPVPSCVGDGDAPQFAGRTETEIIDL